MGRSIRKLIIAAATAVTLVVALVPGATGASAAPAVYPAPGYTSGPYWLVFGHSNKCLDVAGGNTANIQLTQYTCTAGALNEQWNLNFDVDHNYFEIQNLKTHKCVNVSGDGITDGTPIIQYPCSYSYLNEEFSQDFDDATGTPVPPGQYYWIRAFNPYPPKVIHQSGASQANGAPVTLWDESFTAKNTWIRLATPS